ncbi:Uncharacterised protein [Leclercia adecarboxylata]|uniref:Uncharacterized protein n=1 Tax=Leclercia adecarboxylata TaxID=83655 RepID=A0A4U9IUE2_9ENTR|nr:Uncharacterised protein [Leclercia adecarboxylata]
MSYHNVNAVEQGGRCHIVDRPGLSHRVYQSVQYVHIQDSDYTR